jgi:hypothetical protein
VRLPRRRPQGLRRGRHHTHSDVDHLTIYDAPCSLPGASFAHLPQLRDPADELVLEAAVNGQAEALVTFNRRDFGAVPAQLGIDLLTPAEAIRRIRT